jgi:hypothetical protein
MAKFSKKPDKERGKLLRLHESQEISPEQQPPLFSLRHLDKVFCLSVCNKDEKAAFADTLHRLSQLTWSQIRQVDRHKLGYEVIRRECLKSSIPAHLKEDVRFIAFRFCGLAPMVGYREMATFHILWLDPKFCLYDH